jgi:hypothetical protein
MAHHPFAYDTSPEMHVMQQDTSMILPRAVGSVAAISPSAEQRGVYEYFVAHPHLVQTTGLPIQRNSTATS